MGSSGGLPPVGGGSPGNRGVPSPRLAPDPKKQLEGTWQLLRALPRRGCTQRCERSKPGKVRAPTPTPRRHGALWRTTPTASHGDPTTLAGRLRRSASAGRNGRYAAQPRVDRCPPVRPRSASAGTRIRHCLFNFDAVGDGRSVLGRARETRERYKAVARVRPRTRSRPPEARRQAPVDLRAARWERLRPRPQQVRGKQHCRCTARSATPARANVSVLQRAARRAWIDTRRRRPGSAAEGSALSGSRQPSLPAPAIRLVVFLLFLRSGDGHDFGRSRDSATRPSVPPGRLSRPCRTRQGVDDPARELSACGARSEAVRGPLAILPEEPS